MPAKKRARRPRKNPLLAIVNPGQSSGSVIFGTSVHSVRYRHVTEGDRKHNFGVGVRMEGLSDGSIRLFHKTKRLWGDQ